LATATGTGSSGYGALGFGYDAAGNLKSKGAIGSPLLLSYAGGNAGPHGVTGVTGPETGSFVYDGDGQVTAKTRSGGTQALIRDDDGRIREVPYFAEYVYDETGERARKQTFSGAGDTLYVDPEFEVDLVNATHEIHYFHGSRRVATEKRSGLGLPGGGGAGSLLSRQFYFPDFVGSNSVVARSDGTLQKSFFRPFGEFAQEGGDLSPYLFTDQEHDPETNLQYFGARYYDPWVGRFMEQDPELIGAHDGATFAAIADDAQQYNSYSYVTNRPTILVDPTGRQSVVEGFVRKAKELTKDSPGKQVEKLAEKMEGKFDRIGTGGDTVGDETVPKPSIGDIVDGVVAAEAARSGGAQGDAGEQATGDSNASSGVAQETGAQETGSYTNYHESGMTYSGKGSRERSQVSGREKEKKYGDRHTATDWEKAPNEREAFKAESRRVDQHGGVDSSSNYNRVESPGKRFRQEDGEL
jgi:RHS repeat-associated protein